MLKRTTVFERAAMRAQQYGFDLQVEAIAQRDVDSQRALSDAQELYASTEAWASTVTKQEDLAMCTRQVNQWEQEVEKLEGLLQEREELDDITIRHELEALSTRKTCLDHREADLEQEQKALEDACAQILAHEG
jgi:predicted  nucleic acid-binding Zn-ribbon protein